MKEASRPDMAALWKNFALPDEPEPVKTPAVAIGTVHGAVLSIVTTQPIEIGELWAQACAARAPESEGKGSR